MRRGEGLKKQIQLDRNFVLMKFTRSTVLETRSSLHINRTGTTQAVTCVCVSLASHQASPQPPDHKESLVSTALTQSLDSWRNMTHQIHFTQASDRNIFLSPATLAGSKPLSNTGKLWQVLVATFSKGSWKTGQGAEKSHKNDLMAGENALQCKTQRAQSNKEDGQAVT